MNPVTRLKLLVSFLLLSNVTFGQSLIENGDFAKWNSSGPVGWTIDSGATSGNASQKSSVKKGGDGSLQLGGNAQTNNWQFVSQAFSVEPGEKYFVQFQAKAENLRREAGQRDNCYVGVLLKDKRGKNLKFETMSVISDDYLEYKRQVDIPKPASKAVVAMFLSKTGTLSVKNADFKKLKPEDSFDVLVSEMDRNYSYFVHKKIDWPKLTEKYRQQANSVATDRDAFAKVVWKMLREWKDGHIWVETPRFTAGSSISWNPNFDFDVVGKDLIKVRKFADLGLVAKTRDGFGYVRIDSFEIIRLEWLNDFVSVIEDLMDVPGMIVDLRNNRGGAEYNAQVIAGLFASERVVYAQQARRIGPRHSDLAISGRRMIGPSRKKNFRKPVVCLLGPGTVSSGEGMAMMFKAIKSVTTVGLPTRGSSGNPMPVTLPNGVTVWYSRWVSMMPDGTIIEDRGVQPDIVVKHQKGTDRAYAKAIEILKRKTKPKD